MRPWAMERKAWLLAGSELAGKRAATVMSLVQSARLYGHDPWVYFRDVLTRLPTHLARDIDDLLPHRRNAIKKQHRDPAGGRGIETLQVFGLEVTHIEHGHCFVHPVALRQGRAMARCHRNFYMRVMTCDCINRCQGRPTTSVSNCSCPLCQYDLLHLPPRDQ